MKNVNVNALKKTLEEFKAKPDKSKDEFVLEAKWNTGSAPQVSSRLEFERGISLWEADNPAGMGGKGGKPDPFQYFLFGLTSHLLTTFAALASLEGVEIYALSARSDCTFNRNSLFSDEQPLEAIKLIVTVNSKEPKEKLDALLQKTISKSAAASVMKLNAEVRVEA